MSIKSSQKLHEDYKGWSYLLHVLCACHAFDEQDPKKLSAHPNNTGLVNHTESCDSLRFHPVAAGALVRHLTSRIS